MPARIFICYRRSDTAPWAGRLHDRLAQVFGEDQVFFDVHGIEPGEDFPRILEERLAQCKVMLVVIGRHWLSLREQDGSRSIDDAKDYVRREIKAALGRNIRVVPVLVNSATLPGEHELPAEIRALCDRQAVELTHARFLVDAQTLIETLTRATLREADELGVLPAPTPAPDREVIDVDRHRFPLALAAGASVTGMTASMWLGVNRPELDRVRALAEAPVADAPLCSAITGGACSIPSVMQHIGGGGWILIAFSLLLLATAVINLVLSGHRNQWANRLMTGLAALAFVAAVIAVVQVGSVSGPFHM